MEQSFEYNLKMPEIQPTSNFIKHTNNNPVQKLLVNNFYKILVSLAKKTNPETILDAGCGEGFSINQLTINKVGKKLEGVDDSEIALSLGKKLFPYLHFKKGNVYNLPYKNNSFDLVVCTEVLEHLNNPRKALTEAMRVSKKYVIVSVPNEPFFMLANFLRGKNIAHLGNDPGHINHWSFLSFRKLLNVKGLKIKNIKYPFPWIIALIEK